MRLLDRMGRNPLQLAESKLKLLQKRNIGENFLQIHNEVLQVSKLSLKHYNSLILTNYCFTGG